MIDTATATTLLGALQRRELREAREAMRTAHDLLDAGMAADHVECAMGRVDAASELLERIERQLALGAVALRELRTIADTPALDLATEDVVAADLVMQADASYRHLRALGEPTEAGLPRV